MTTIAEFTVEFTRFIDRDGKALQTLPEFTQDTDTLLQLYRYMVITRTFDSKAIALQRTGKMGTYASSLGQEAIGVAIGNAMQPQDVLCPSYREHAIMMQRGVKLSEILLYWGGDERGSQYANNTQDLPICVPIATQCLHAAGVAKAFQLRRENRVAVSVCGDGGTSQGDFYEAMNVAGAWKLPVVFVVNNNQWAISVPRQSQTGAETIAQKGIAAGIDCYQVDGNDVLAMRHIMSCALDNARNHQRPSIIEAITYRLCDHTTADDASRYVNKEALENAKAEEPLKRMRQFLLNQKLWDESKENALQSEANQLVQQAVQEYEATSPQPAEAMFDYLYASLPDALAEQYADVIEFGGKS
jgi:2-oxoisovalerate dehydrogenase E1 component alpha subunit